ARARGPEKDAARWVHHDRHRLADLLPGDLSQPDQGMILVSAERADSRPLLRTAQSQVQRRISPRVCGFHLNPWGGAHVPDGPPSFQNNRAMLAPATGWSWASTSRNRETAGAGVFGAWSGIAASG